MSNKLIIIGNGFDLHAGLESTFSKFFEKNELPKIEEWLKKRTPNELNDLSFVSLLLYNSYYRKDCTYQDFNLMFHNIRYNESYSNSFGLKEKLIDWMDVEGFLNSILRSRSIDKLISCFNQNSKYQYDGKNKCICELDDIALFIKQCITPRKYFSVDSFYDFLLEELKIFENGFVNYLNKELKENKGEYFSNSSRIFSCLAGEGDSGIILNFNYTHITDCKKYKEINIHGSLENEIIIGIDDQEDLSVGAIQFTKTFRKLIDTNKSIVLDKTFDEIIIYGHSLGEQDYSYFQSIFDFVGTYSGRTIIKFVYSDDYIKDDGFNVGYTKNLHRIKMAQKLFGLMRSYGKTLDNKDNGQNLIHKMILEGRLKIELDNFEKETIRFRTCSKTKQY